MVHLAVKLKCRLLKPSIILPMGSYIASSAHLHILVQLIGKDKHGIRAKDLDSKDKQNFAAVEHLIKASHFLSALPDVLGTKCYLEVTKVAVYSYLDKSISPEQRLEEIWYATFFFWFWRQWVTMQKSFTLKNNFITSNSYMCIEINAHSLLAYTIMMRDTYNDQPEVFTPWLMGSQSCEQNSEVFAA